MKKLLPLTVVLVLVALLLVSIVSGCRDSSGRPETGKTTKREMEWTEKNQERLLKAVPPPALQTSLERINLKRYLEEINQEDRISYIYLVNFGKVMAFYPIKGKVTYCSSKMTTREQIIHVPYGGESSNRYHVMESPGLDGSYGPSEDAIFFWTTEGVLIQWRGDYMWCSEPLQMSTPPALVYNVDKN